MIQDERWAIRYNEVVEIIRSSHRNPSRHRIDEHNMLYWLKANRKRMNAGELKPERLVSFNKLCELSVKYRYVNPRV